MSAWLTYSKEWLAIRSIVNHSFLFMTSILSKSKNKVSSIIAYDDNNTDSTWSCEVSSIMIFSFWFKLRMTESDISAVVDDSLLIQTMRRDLLRISERKSAEELCQDYLINLYQYIINKLVRQFIKSVIDVTSIKFVLTASANWSERYRKKSITAIIAA